MYLPIFFYKDKEVPTNNNTQDIVNNIGPKTL